MTKACPYYAEPRTSRLRDVLLWSTAAFVMFSAHVTSAAWLLNQTPPPIADDGPPPAIMIELAAEPEAVNTESEQISEDVEDAPEVASVTPTPVQEVVDPLPAEPQPEPEPEPEPETTQTIPTPEPLPEPVEEIDPIEQQMATLMENVEVPLPVFRPPPPRPEVKKVEEPKKVVKKEKPKEKPKASPVQPSRASLAAAAEVAQGNRNAAAQSSAGSSASSVSPARWQSKVQAHLARRKKQLSKSRDKGERGTVYVRFNIDTSGNVLSVALSRSSGHSGLDQDVLALVRNASPVPAPPPNVDRTLVVPFEFTTR